MIVALFALSAAMVIGGVAAVIQGFPFVRLESGLAMVIAGATVAAAGAVLAGLGIVAVGLRRVERAFDARRIVDAVGTVQEGVRTAASRPDPAVAWLETDPAPSAPPPAVRPSLPSVQMPAADVPPGQTRTEPAFSDPIFEDPHPAKAEPDPREPELPLPGLTPPPAEKLAPEPASSAEDDLFAAPEVPPPASRVAAAEAVVVTEPALVAEPHLVSGPRLVSGTHLVMGPDLVSGQDLAEPPPLRPSLDAGLEHEPPAEPASRDVVGRYASGGNTYVMFADGGIEAETPQGRFSFASLDELKAFVDGGGEAGTHGAA